VVSYGSVRFGKLRFVLRVWGGGQVVNLVLAFFKSAAHFDLMRFGVVRNTSIGLGPLRYGVLQFAGIG